MAKKGLLLIILLSFLNSFVFAYQSAQVALVSEPFKGQMAYDQNLGMLIDPLKSEIESEVLTFKAFNGFYNSAWFESYVQKESLLILNRLYNRSLSEWLPAKVLVGQVKREQSYDLIPLIIYPIQTKEKHTLEVIWEVNDQNEWSITMINVLKSKRP